MVVEFVVVAAANPEGSIAWIPTHYDILRRLARPGTASAVAVAQAKLGAAARGDPAGRASRP
jgi:hypothetical protein